MKQSLDLRLGQHLTITPQLQQAIRLLQLSSVELQQEIQQALESNPLLEEKELAEPGAETPAADSPADSETDSYDGADRPAAEAGENPGEGAAENDWSEEFDQPIAARTRAGGDDDGFDIDGRNSLPTTLRDHLLWQMHMTPFSDADRRIAETLIDALNEDGYLTLSLEDVQQILAKEHIAAEVDEIQAVLHQIQNFDPVGVGARGLAECLQLQLRALPASTPWLKEATALATDANLGLLGARDHAALRRALRLAPESLTAALQLIQTLNPRPGAGIQSATAGYVTPDVIVKKVRGVWRAELNGDISPRLRINRQYERMIQRGNASSSNRYLQDQLQQARWFIKSLNSRNDTLLKVARTIVDRQRAFFDHGPEAMKPLVLHDIAEAVGMHESTISRVTTNKYMLTPRGIFELKYFFSSHVATADGGACSATAIRSMIKKLVEDEPSAKPISDSKIAEVLAGQGIHVARRTIAKYRELMNIPPSSRRKSLI
jgi:RNA polymerase sigma-54 factor